MRGVGLRTMQRWIASGKVPSIGEGLSALTRKRVILDSLDPAYELVQERVQDLDRVRLRFGCSGAP